MLRPFIISVVLVVLGCHAEGKARCFMSTRNATFGCMGISKFSGNLDKASSTVKSLWFHTCEFTNVPTNNFYRFRNTLQSIDMHRAGIQTIEGKAFNGLTKLENLILWGNTLEAVYAEWFANLTQLKTLDLSFNRISYIEEMVFPLVPNLQNLYIDSNNMAALNWNVFSYLTNLKRAKIGKNPWNWWYRAQITRQLDDQQVDYASEWDDYNWINHVVWDCMQKHQAKYEDDSVLDCASSYLLEEHSKIHSGLNITTDCLMDAKLLYDCYKGSRLLLPNVTITQKIAVRQVLQGFIGTYNSMRHPGVQLTERVFN